MANEFARNIVDANLTKTFALPTTLQAAGATASSGIDLGANTYSWSKDNVELVLDVPELNATMAPAAATTGATYIIEGSASSTFNGTVTIKSETYAGSASGVAAKSVRARIPSDGPRYVRGKVQLSTTCTDASAVTGTFSLMF